MQISPPLEASQEEAGGTANIPTPRVGPAHQGQYQHSGPHLRVPPALGWSPSCFKPTSFSQPVHQQNQEDGRPPVVGAEHSHRHSRKRNQDHPTAGTNHRPPLGGKGTDLLLCDLGLFGASNLSWSMWVALGKLLNLRLFPHP